MFVVRQKGRPESDPRYLHSMTIGTDGYVSAISWVSLIWRCIKEDDIRVLLPMIDGIRSFDMDAEIIEPTRSDGVVSLDSHSNEGSQYEWI